MATALPQHIMFNFLHYYIIQLISLASTMPRWLSTRIPNKCHDDNPECLQREADEDMLSKFPAARRQESPKRTVERGLVFKRRAPKVKWMIQIRDTYSHETTIFTPRHY